MRALTDNPDSPDAWRPLTARFGRADWDTATLDAAAIVDAEGGGALAVDAAAAAEGDTDAARRLGLAGVVAIRAAGTIFEVHESVDGWELHPSAGTPDIADLAMAAAIRATRLAAERRGARSI